MKLAGLLRLILLCTLIANTVAQDNNAPRRAPHQTATTARAKQPLEYRGLRLGMEKDAAYELLQAINAPFVERENARRAHEVEVCIAAKEDKTTEANYLLTVRNAALKEYTALLAADPVLPIDMQIQRTRRMTTAKLQGSEEAQKERALQTMEAQLFKFTGTQSWSEFQQKYGNIVATPEKLPDGVRLYIAFLSDQADPDGHRLPTVIGELVDARVKRAQRDLHSANAQACELANPTRTPQCGDPECEGCAGGLVAGMTNGRVSSVLQDNLDDIGSYVAAFTKKYGKPQAERHNQNGVGSSWTWVSGSARLELRDVCGQDGTPGTPKGCLVLRPNEKAGPEI